MSRAVVPQDFVASRFSTCMALPDESHVLVSVGDLRRLVASEAEWHHRAISLRDNVKGTSGECRGCGAPIKFIEHGNGKRPPYTADAQNHFIDCPAAAQFKRSA